VNKRIGSIPEARCLFRCRLSPEARAEQGSTATCLDPSVTIASNTIVVVDVLVIIIVIVIFVTRRRAPSPPPLSLPPLFASQA